MTKKAFDKIAAGLNEAIAIARGDGLEPDHYEAHLMSEIRRLQHLLQVYLQERAQGVGRAGK